MQYYNINFIGPTEVNKGLTIQPQRQKLNFMRNFKEPYLDTDKDN